MASFVLHPKKLSSITFDIAGSSPSSNYVVAPNSIDMNEKERIKVVYSSLDMGGLAIKSTSGLVDSSFVAVIFGANQAAAMANFRTLCAALRQEGTLEYIPVGLSGVMSTYYHYLPSAPPEIIPGSLDESVMGSYGRSGGNGEYAVVCRVTLTNKAIATSDITSPATIVSKTTLDGFDDTGTDNSLVVANTSIKGDFLFPVVEIDGGANSLINWLVLYIRPMRTGANTNLDYMEAEDASLTGMTSEVNANASEGYVAFQAHTSAQGFMTFSFSGLDSTYLGKVVPIIYSRVDYDPGASFTITPRWVQGANTIVTYKDLETDDTVYTLLTEFEEMDFPPSKLPDAITDATTPSIGNFASGAISFQLECNQEVGAGSFAVDFVILARSDFFISKLTTDIALGSAHVLRIDSYEQAAYAVDGDGYFAARWTNNGSAYSNMILPKGFDYRFRFLKNINLNTAAVPTAIKGIYGTIYPFEVA